MIKLVTITCARASSAGRPCEWDSLLGSIATTTAGFLAGSVCHAKAFSSLAGMIQQASLLEGIPEDKHDALEYLALQASLLVAAHHPSPLDFIINTLDTTEGLSAADLESMLEEAQTYPDSDDVVEALAFHRARLAGFDLIQWAADVTALSHPDLREALISELQILVTLSNVIPYRLMAKWDRHFADVLCTFSPIRVRVFSLNNITKKVGIADRYLTRWDDSLKTKAAITSMVIWKSRLHGGHGSIEQLEEAGHALDNIELAPVFLEQRERLGLYIPKTASRIPVTEFKKLTGTPAQRDIENGYDNDDDNITTMVMLESRLAALRHAWPEPDASVFAYETVVRRMQLAHLSKYLEILETSVEREQPLLRSMIQNSGYVLTFAVTPKTFEEAKTLATAHQYNEALSREIKSLNSVITKPDAVLRLLADIHSCADLPARLQHTTAALISAEGHYTSVVEGCLANLAVWRRRLMLNGMTWQLRKRDDFFIEVHKIISTQMWAFLALRVKLGLPEFELLPEPRMIKQVAAFVCLPANTDNQPFRQLYYTEEEAVMTRGVSLYVAVMLGIRQATKKTVPLAVSEYLEESVLAL